LLSIEKRAPILDYASSAEIRWESFWRRELGAEACEKGKPQDFVRFMKHKKKRGKLEGEKRHILHSGR